jgi:hypothetical protein
MSDRMIEVLEGYMGEGSIPPEIAHRYAVQCKTELLTGTVEAVIGVLAPNGIPIFEWGHETTPTDEQIRELAEQIVAAIERGEPS